MDANKLKQVVERVDSLAKRMDAVSSDPTLNLIRQFVGKGDARTVSDLLDGRISVGPFHIKRAIQKGVESGEFVVNGNKIELNDKSVARGSSKSNRFKITVGGWDSEEIFFSYNVSAKDEIEARTEALKKAKADWGAGKKPDFKILSAYLV